MDNEEKEFVKEYLERKKKELTDYLEFAKIAKIPEKEQKKIIDIYLDDISKILKQLK